MRMLTRSIPVAALALALGAVTAAAQESGQRDFQWYIGPQAGVMLFDTPVQDRKAMPSRQRFQLHRHAKRYPVVVICASP